MKTRRLMLDTSVCVEWLRRPARERADAVRSIGIERVAISSIVHAELAFGAAAARDPDASRELVARLLRAIPVLPFDTIAAQAYGDARHAMRTRGRTVGAMDLLIGAHALALDADLATLDLRDFGRIPGLRVVHWG